MKYVVIGLMFVVNGCMTEASDPKCNEIMKLAKQISPNPITPDMEKEGRAECAASTDAEKDATIAQLQMMSQLSGVFGALVNALGKGE